MKKFENPTLEVEIFEVSDVITTSDCPDYACSNDLGCPTDW